MSVTIDSLDIQIRSSAGSASQNIEKLADALSKLNGSANLTKTVNALGKLNTALSNMKSQSSVMSHLSSMSKSLSSLASIPEATGLKSAIKELKKLPALTQSLDAAKIGQFSAKIKLLANGLAPLATQIEKISKGFSKLPSQVSKCVTAVKRLDSANRSATKSTKSHGEALNAQSFNLLATYEHLSNVFSMMHGIQDGFTKLLNGAIQWDSIQFQFGRAFGEDAEMVLEYADKVSQALRINKQQFMESASLYGSLLKGFGVEQKQVTTMAVGLAELSYDIWAAYNNRYKTLDDASEAVRSAITGEIEPIRNAGIALTEASMQEYLDSIGMAHVSMEKLTEAQKSEVRYATMVNAAMNQGIIGTYAREMETAEGAIRTMTQQLTTLGQALGSLFIPMLKTVIPWLTAFVELITEGVIALGAMFGINFQEITWGNAAGMKQTADGAVATADALGDAAKSAKAMKDYTMGFDELNIIKPDSDTGSGGAGAGAGGVGGGSLGLDLDTLWNDAVLASASKQIDELKAKIKEYVNEHKIMLGVVGTVTSFLGLMKVLRGLNALFGITKTIDNVKTAFDGLGNATSKLKTAGSNVKAFFSLLKSGGGLGPTLAAAFPNAANLLSTIGTWVTGTFVPAFKTAITKIPSLLGIAVRALPWIGLATAIISAIALVVADMDFTDIGYKIGHGLGSILKKVGEWLGSAWDWVWEIGKGILSGVESAWEWVKETFDINNVFELIYMMFNPVAWVTKITPKMIEIGKEVLPGLWQGIKNGWNNFWGNINELISGFVQGFKDALGIHSPSTVFADIGTNIVAGLLGGITTKWAAIKQWFSTTVAPKLTLSFWVDKFKNLKEGFTQTIKNAVNAGIDMMNKFIGWLNEKLRFSWEGLSIMGKQIYPGGSVQLFTISKIPRLADGGFVGAGQMFIAREAGPELVGSINGRTAVANNDQIVAAVSQGVYSAVVAAMSSVTGSNGQNVNVYLDGKQIYASVKKTESERGRVLMGNQLGYAY